MRRGEADDEIQEEIERIVEILPQSGYRSVTTILRRTRFIGKKRVARVMRERGLKCRQKPAFRTATTDSKHSLRKFPNLLQDPEKSKLPTIVGDVTYYDIRGVNYYCAHLLDLTCREPVGIAVSNRLDADLVCAALMMAIEKRGSLEGYIHHTDSDSRYCSAPYIELLESSGAEISMCVGNAYENAHSESFNATLKRQEINLNEYSNKADSAQKIFAFVEKYINIRPHSALGMMTPAEYRKKILAEAQK